MPPIPANVRYLRLGKETTWGTPATTFFDMRVRNFQMTQISARAESQNRAVGKRSANTLRPVPGRRHSEGQWETDWIADTGGLLALLALGSETVVADPATAITRKKHTARKALRPPSATVQAFDGSQVASVNKAYQYAGVDLARLTLSYQTTEDEGVLTASYQVMGKSYGTGTADLVNTVTFSPSAMLHIAAWKPSLLRAAVADTKVRSFEINIDTGLTRQKSGAGTQEDQGHVFTVLAVAGQITREMNDVNSEDIMALAESITPQALLIQMTGHTFIETVTAVSYYDGLDINIPEMMVMGAPIRSEADGLMIETFNFVGYDEAANPAAPIEIITYNDKPAY